MAEALAARRRELMLPVLALLWAGLVLGVAVAASAKFQASSLTLQVALDVGRHEFTRLNRIELGLAALALLGVLLARPRPLLFVALGVVLAVLAAQSLWLLPALSQRAARYLSGQRPPASSSHLYYVIAEGLKLLALTVLAWGGLQPRPASRAQSG